MGWNDHVDFVETTCEECGETDTWEMWNEVALARYGGNNRHLGEMLGHDDNKANRCPHCGSIRGTPVDTEAEDREAYWDNLLSKDD